MICWLLNRFCCRASRQLTSWLDTIFVPLISWLVWSVWHWLATCWLSILVVWGRRVLAHSSIYSFDSWCRRICRVLPSLSAQSLVNGGTVPCCIRGSGQSLSLQHGLSRRVVCVLDGAVYSWGGNNCDEFYDVARVDAHERVTTTQANLPHDWCGGDKRRDDSVSRIWCQTIEYLVKMVLLLLYHQGDRAASRVKHAAEHGRIIHWDSSVKWNQANLIPQWHFCVWCRKTSYFSAQGATVFVEEQIVDQS